MEAHPIITEINQLNRSVVDRREFHKRVGPLLEKMAQDQIFWANLFRQNLSDRGYLQRKWSMYEIPFFYVFENDDFYLKVHLFVPLRGNATNIAASAIHHHNNYLLTSYAAFGSGYETMLFEKEVTIDPATNITGLKIRERFTQKDRPVHMVDAWEPHVVVNPVSLSATLVLWSPDKKRATDNLRSNPLLKAFKKPLRKLIYALGLEKKIGISAKDTFQFYTKDKKFIAIPEDEFFEPTRKQMGAQVDDYSVQTIFAFMQRMNFDDKSFFRGMLSSKDVPLYYHKWIGMILNNEPIPDTYAKESINIPDGVMTIEDILRADTATNTTI